MSENVGEKKTEVTECDTASEASYAASTTSSHKPSGIRPPSVRIGRPCTAHCTPKASHPPPSSESKIFSPCGVFRLLKCTLCVTGL
ncbi:hypothetical protein DMENIID0001_062450 [Sergentomyia squamirostris]